MADIRTACSVLQQFNDEITFAPEGSTIQECYQLLNGDPILRPMIRAFHRGMVQKDWDTITREGEHVVFVIVPAGGDDGSSKQIMAMVAMVAIMILTRVYVPGLVEGMAPTGMAIGASSTTATLYGMSYATATNVAIAGVSLLGSLAVGAIFKPSIPGLNAQVISNMTDPEQSSPMITGQSNSARINGIIPVIFGRHTIYPDVAAHPYIDKAGCKQTLHAVYCLGFGPLGIEADTLHLGGVPWSLLQQSNPGMKYQFSNQMISNYVPEWYEGIRDVDNTNLILNIYDGTEYPVVVTPTAGAHKVFLDIIFPAGLFDVSTNGNITNHTCVIKIEKKVGGNWVLIDPQDVLSSSDDLICAPIDENVAHGAITIEESFDNSWAILAKVINSGADDSEKDSVSLIEYYGNPTELCGDSGGQHTRKRGWNVGINGNMGTYEAVCGDSNLKGAHPGRTGGVHGYMYLDNPAENGQVYYTIGIESKPELDDGGYLAEGHYNMSFMLFEPSDYNSSDPLHPFDPVTDAIAQPFIVGLDANGVKIATIARGDTGIISQDGTRFAASVYLGRHSPYKRLQFAVTFDYLENRTTASRKSVVRLKLCSMWFVPETKTIVVEEESRIKIKVPQLGGSIANEQEAPRQGDVLYFGIAVESDCSTCIPLGHKYVVAANWVEDEWGNVGLKPVYAEYMRKVTGSGHAVMNITKTGTDVGGSQHYGIYEVGLDDPVTHTANMIFTERLIPAGFSITGDYRAPINMGLLVKYYEQFRLTKTTTAPNTATETATLATVSSIQVGGALVTVPNEKNLVYSLLEISIPANEMLGSTIKPLSLTVNKAGRDYSPGMYHEDRVHDPDIQGSSAADYTENPAWTYINVLMGNAGARVLGVQWGHYLTDFIDLESFRSWAVMCEDEGFRCATILTGYTTVGDLLTMIAATGRGRPTFRDGKHSIIFDGDPRYFEKDADGHPVPIERQMITPENSWDGSSRMAYMAATHALKVQYLDFDTRKTAEVIIYAPGFAQDGNDFYADEARPWKAQKFETMNLPAVNHWQQAAKLGQYFMDEVRLRRERVVRTLDIENLISEEGDIVAVADDVMRLGGKPGWISETTGPNGNIVLTIKDPMPKLPAGASPGFGIKIRCFDQATQLPILTKPLPAEVDPYGNGDNTQVRVTVPSNFGVRVGYMVLWGTIDRISSPFQIASIKYSADLTATLEMVEYYADPLNYEGDRIVIPESPLVGEVATPKGLQLSLIVSPALDGSGWTIKYMVSWQHVPAIIDGGYYLVEFTEAIRPAITVDNVHITASYFRPCGSDKGTMGVKVYAVDTFGNRSEPAIETSDTHPPEYIPPPVVSFAIELGKESTKLTWKGVSNDIAPITGYEIRYFSSIRPAESSWELNSHEIFSGGGAAREAFTHHRKGTFYIKSIGMCGLESKISAVIISDVSDDIDASKTVHYSFYDKTIDGELEVYGCVETQVEVTSAGVNGATFQYCKRSKCNLRIKGTTAQIGTATDSQNTDDWVNPYTSNMISPIFQECGLAGLFTTTKCFVQENWIIFNPDYGAAQISRNTEQLLDVDVEVFSVQAPQIPGVVCASYREPDSSYHHMNTTKSHVYYKTWAATESAPPQWILLTGGLVVVKEHIQIAIKHTRTKGDGASALYKIKIGVKYLARTESIDNIVITNANAGATITYAGEFMFNPAISIMGQDLRPGDYWQFTAQTTAGFTIKFYDSSGRAKAASFDWIANGYGTKRK